MLRRMGYGLGVCTGGGDAAIAPVNIVAPVASGTARVGQTLSSTAGTWDGTPTISYAYQWRRDGADIGGATSATYILATADIGAAVDCVVTATNGAGSASQDSNDIVVPDFLDAVLASAVFDLDATKTASYSGSGTTWANGVAAPADGSAQTAYDFYTGNGSTSSTYPAFTGSAGDDAAYWSFDGGDYFSLKSGVNTAFINALHKTTGGSDFWFAVTWRTPAADGNYDMLFATHTSASTVGLSFSQTNGEILEFGQRGDSALSYFQHSGAVLGGTTNYIVMLSHSHSSNQTRIWINAATAAEFSHSFNATTANATAVMNIAARNGSVNVGNGTRLYSVAMGNEYLDNAKAAAVIAAMEARHGRDYTP